MFFGATAFAISRQSLGDRPLPSFESPNGPSTRWGWHILLQIFPHTHFPDFTEAILCIGDILTPVSRVLHADPSACILPPQISWRSKRIDTNRAFGPEWDLVEVERRSEKP